MTLRVEQVGALLACHTMMVSIIAILISVIINSNLASYLQKKGNNLCRILLLTFNDSESKLESVIGTSTLSYSS